MITAIDKQSALVLIDLQKMTLSNFSAETNEIVLANANKLIDAFRDKNLPVIFINVKPNAAWMKTRKEVNMQPVPDDENLFKLSDQLHTTATDIYITKHTWNAFFETNLHDEMKQINITGIVLCGVSTSIGVEGTARAASELGYNISFATDAMQDRASEAHERSVKFIFPRIGETGTTNEIIAMMDKHYK